MATPQVSDSWEQENTPYPLSAYKKDLKDFQRELKEEERMYTKSVKELDKDYAAVVKLIHKDIAHTQKQIAKLSKS